MGRNERSLKQQAIFRNNVLVTHVQNIWTRLLAHWDARAALFWSGFRHCQKLGADPDFGDTQGMPALLWGAFRAFGLWNKPWLSQDLPGKVARGPGSPEYLAMEHPAQGKRALLGQCLWLGRLWSNLWHLMGTAGSDEVEFQHKCSENPPLSLASCLACLIALEG